MPGKRKTVNLLPEEKPEDVRREIADEDTVEIESGVGSESDMESPIVPLPPDEDLPDEVKTAVIEQMRHDMRPRFGEVTLDKIAAVTPIVEREFMPPLTEEDALAQIAGNDRREWGDGLRPAIADIRKAVNSVSAFGNIPVMEATIDRSAEEIAREDARIAATADLSLPDDLKAKIGEATDEPRIQIPTITQEEFAVLSGHIPIDVADAAEVRFKSGSDAEALLAEIREVGNFGLQTGSLDDGGTVSVHTYSRESVIGMLLSPMLCYQPYATWLLATVYGIDVQEPIYRNFRDNLPPSNLQQAPGELKVGVFHQIDVKIKRLTDTAKMPVYAHDTDSGADVFSDQDMDILGHNHRALVQTGITLILPEGYGAFVHDRSGISTKNGVLKIAGVIDNGYRGELLIALINTGEKVYHIERGQKIAQIVFAPVYKGVFEEVTDLGATERGDGGFGSTGL